MMELIRELWLWVEAHGDAVLPDWLDKTWNDRWLLRVATFGLVAELFFVAASTLWLQALHQERGRYRTFAKAFGGVLLTGAIWLCSMSLNFAGVWDLPDWGFRLIRASFLITTLLSIPVANALLWQAMGEEWCRFQRWRAREIGSEPG